MTGPSRASCSGQDDGEEYGIPNIEKYNLLGYIQDLNLTDRQVFLTHGADEIALSLLAAWHNETTGYAPKIFVQYNDPGAHDRVMPYMAVSTGVCTEEKIRLTGGSLAASPEEADFTLLVSTNDTDKDTLWSRGACVRLLEDNLAKGQPTALVDLSKHFNADETVLPQLIAAAFPSTACWPTRAGTRRATPSARRLPRPASTAPRWKQ